MRGQITVFVVLGLVVLLVAGLSFLVYRTVFSLDPEVERNLIITNDIKPLQLYVENCLMQSAAGPLVTIGVNGGRIEPLIYRWHDGQKYSYLCTLDTGCMHEPLFRQDIENEIEKAVIPIVQQCIDLTILERQAFTVTTGDISLNATVGRDEVTLKLYYPIRLQKEDVDLSSEVYIVDVDVPLGRLFELAIGIVNSENSKGYYDQVEYIKSNQVIIEKHRPYPDIVYNLTYEDYVFRFAMQPGPAQFGCCFNTYDNLCYKNSRMDACVSKGGIFELFCECPAPEPEEECEDCQDCSSGKHGESWCHYETIAGQGYDFVGTRHYMYYCIDGREYVEECADYREELCTEQMIDGQNKAMCRPNRWQDCSSCSTQECCEDTRLRDCDWKEWLNTKSQCVPYVPPGFRFWDSAGAETCHLRTEITECEGFSCPNVWVDDTAISCYSQGDCGNYRNIQGILSKGGFFNSDFADVVREHVYNEKYHAAKGGDYHIDLGLYNRQTAQVFSPIDNIGDSFTEIFNMITDYIERMTDISPSHFLNPFSDTKFSILDIAVCDVWQAPVGSDACSLCTELDNICTEYRCRSLGTNCLYVEEQGVPDCIPKAIGDTEPPVLSIDVADKNTIPVKQQFVNNLFTGVALEHSVEPYSTITVLLNTSEETICRTRYLPKVPYISSPSFVFGEARFAKHHNVTIRIPKRLPLPVQVMELVNITSLSELVELFREPSRFLSKFESKFGKYFEKVEKVTGFDFLSMVMPYISQSEELLNRISDTLPYYEQLFATILGSYENGKYYFFIECTDHAGNKNRENLLVFTINMTDERPPVILGFSPQNNSIAGVSDFIVYVNEPAECRFDTVDLEYDEMNSTLDCNGRSSQFHSSYTCAGSVEQTPIYIRCRDRPGDTEHYPVNIVRSSRERVNIDFTEYINVSEGIITAPLYMLDEETIFEVRNDSVKFQLYSDTISNCSYITNKTKYDMHCQNTDLFHMGNRVCTAEVELIENPLMRTMELHIEHGPTNVPELVSGTLELEFTDTVVYLNISEVDVEISIDGAFDCANMTCRTKDNVTTCSDFMQTGNTYKIACAKTLSKGWQSLVQVECRVPERERNTNQESTMYVYHRIDPVNIENAGPVGDLDSTIPLLFAETNVPANCGYYQDLQLGTLAMNNVTGTRHEMPVRVDYGGHIYYITCRDDYRNVDTKKVEFFLFE